MLHSRFGPRLTSSERLARIEEKLTLERPRWQLPPPSRVCKDLSKVKVAIVGGGFAGLSAARWLCRLGFSVTVFEARPYVGGRVLSDQAFSKGRITEAGAELIGSMHTMWRDLALEYGLAWISRMDGDLYRREGLELRVLYNRPLPLSEAELALLEKRMRIVLKEISKDAEIIKDASKPWEAKGKDFNIVKDFDDMTVAQKLAKLGINRFDDRWKDMELLLTNNNVAPLEKLNYLGLLCLVKGGQLGPNDSPPMGYWDELEIFRCADGCQALAKKMAEEIEKKKPRCMIHRNAAVKEIDIPKRVLKWASVTYNKGKPVFGKRQEHPFQYVILAIPPGVWKDVTIKPDPKGKVGLMEKGHAAKFFSNMKERFWIKDKKMAPLGGSSKMGQVWEGTDNQTRIVDEKKPENSQGIVLSVFTGTHVRTEADYLKGLKELYPSYDAMLVKKDKLNPKIRPTWLVNWSDEEFIKTGYAAPGKGQVLTVGKRLSEPFEQVMFFAGEHTQMDSFGYMEGALRSGVRAARGVLDSECPQPLVASRGPAAKTSGGGGRLHERAAFEREIGTLLGSAALPEPDRDTPAADAGVQSRIDEYLDHVAAEYTLPGGGKVRARPHFRINGGHSGPDNCRADRRLDTRSKKTECIKEFIKQAIRAHDRKLHTVGMGWAIHFAAYGRGSAEGIRQITQALIDAGKLDDVKKKYPSASTDVDAVRMLQWEFGYGMDCAGYVQLAFLFAWEGARNDSAALREKYGFRSLGNENLYSLASNNKFKKVKYHEAEPGDLLILNAPQGDDAGHTVLVRGRAPAPKGLGDNVHILEVDASWGAGPSGNPSTGGVHRRKFAYNADTGKWGDVQADGGVVWNEIGPYKNHPVQGMYRPRK